MNYFSSEDLDKENLLMNLNRILAFGKEMLMSVMNLNKFTNPVIFFKLRSLEDSLSYAQNISQMLQNLTSQTNNFSDEASLRKHKGQKTVKRVLKHTNRVKDKLSDVLSSIYSESTSSKDDYLSDISFELCNNEDARSVPIIPIDSDTDSLEEIKFSANSDCLSEKPVGSTEKLSANSMSKSKLINCLNSSAPKSPIYKSSKIDSCEVRDLTQDEFSFSNRNQKNQLTSESNINCFVCKLSVKNVDYITASCGHCIHQSCLIKYKEERLSGLRTRLNCKMYKCDGYITFDILRCKLKDGYERSLFEFSNLPLTTEIFKISGGDKAKRLVIF